MRRFLLICAALILFLLAAYYGYYNTSIFLDFHPNAKVTTFTDTQGKEILVDRGDGLTPFEIRGVNLGVGKPGHFATEFAITEDEYMRWFRQIQDMGANTIRVYTINSPAFYEAFYQYNRDNPNPLYLLHGLWVNDYAQYSHMNAYDKDFINPILSEAKELVDVIHGRRNLNYGDSITDGKYRRDISPWVLGYILGVEWEDITVAFTDQMQKEMPRYEGTYFYATEDASPFESVLARLGDTVASYESRRYKTQRLIAFSNWPTTDPLTYSPETSRMFLKIARVDVEHIKTTESFLSGQFASYHIYPYYPDYLRYTPDVSPFIDEHGRSNTYRAYLKTITSHHSMPVVVSEFGVPSSRGRAQIDYGRGFDQGFMSEAEQGEALVTCYEDIMSAGCSGSIVFTWQDEWFKRTWNTMHATDLTQTAYWSDYQTNEQYFGLLSFDPGKTQSVCYVDGDASEWTGTDLVSKAGQFSISVKYDERFIYFLVEGATEDSAVYLPLDITPKTGSTVCADPKLAFERGADFLMILDGKDNSRVLVQERYECLRATFGNYVYGFDPYEFPPEKDTDAFVPIRMIMQLAAVYSEVPAAERRAEIYETGLLLQGNANPSDAAFNSLADFCYGDGFVEVKLPWQLLNFSNPSKMQVHDDYYAHYGVENLSVKSFWVGAGTSDEVISMTEVPLKGWGNRVTYHERLKASYYRMQELWGGEEALP